MNNTCMKTFQWNMRTWELYHLLSVKGEFWTDLVKRDKCILKGGAQLAIGTQFSIQLKRWHFLFHFLSSRRSENEQTWIIITSLKKRKCLWLSMLLYYNWYSFFATFILDQKFVTEHNDKAIIKILFII